MPDVATLDTAEENNSIAEESSYSYQKASFKRLEVDSLSYDPWVEIDASYLCKLPILLGKGQYGAVYLGSWLKSPSYVKEVVALKMPKSIDAPEDELETERKTLRDEIKILAYIGKHENVLQLKGAVTLKKENLCMALEYYEFGSLKKFLVEKSDKSLFHDAVAKHADELSGTTYKTRADQDYVAHYMNSRNVGFISTIDLLNFAMQIGNGMNFLHGKRIIHRDLALRNILLTVDFKIKIADFGLSRKTINGYYTRRITQNQAIPYFWTAPEALNSTKVLLESDWWTFGVVLWELFELGATPYKGVSGDDLLDFLMEGNRLKKPCYCPTEIYKIMISLWNIEPSERMSLSKCQEVIAAQLLDAAGPDLLNEQSIIYEPALINMMINTNTAVQMRKTMEESGKRTFLPTNNYARAFFISAFSLLILIILAMGTLLFIQYQNNPNGKRAGPQLVELPCGIPPANETVKFESWNGYEYMFVSTKIPWKESEQVCAKWAVILQAFTARKKINSFSVINHFFTLNDKMFVEMHEESWAWLGLNDIKTEGIFLWNDGTNNTFRSFYPNEPDIPERNEDCVVQRRFVSDWSDDQCHNASPFVCKKITTLPLFPWTD